jgi:predicted Fe-Mo cluster-binding NifX family protein
VKIAVASDDGVGVAMHTGRCRGFVIYDVAGPAATRLEHRVNGYTAHAQGQCEGYHDHDAGVGHHSHGPLVDALADCAALVTRGLGPRLVADLGARGVEVYTCADENADSAAQMFAQGQLPKARPGGGCCCHRE